LKGRDVVADPWEEDMTDALDVELEDDEQIAEIELLSELMALAGEGAGALDLGTIDATLGLGQEIPAQRLAR
jgi:hypothetical protein